jgi:integrase
MAGCKSLSDNDLDLIDEAFDRLSESDKKGTWYRNRTIFYLQLYTGFRISELLSIRLKQVIEDEDISFYITVQRKNMKGGKTVAKTKADPRTVKLNEKSRDLIRDYLNHYGTSRDDPELFLFRPVRKDNANKAMSSRSCQLIYDRIFEEAKIKEHSTPYRLSTHTCRKTFARHAKDLVEGDLKSLQKMMGHKSLESTSHYVEEDQELIDRAWDNLEF